MSEFFLYHSHKIELPGAVQKTIDLDAMGVAVLFDVPESGDEYYNRNVAFASSEGTIRCYIEGINPGDVTSYWTNIWIDEDDCFKAYNFDGWEATIDIHTGQITSKVERR